MTIGVKRLPLAYQSDQAIRHTIEHNSTIQQTSFGYDESLQLVKLWQQFCTELLSFIYCLFDDILYILQNVHKNIIKI